MLPPERGAKAGGAWSKLTRYVACGISLLLGSLGLVDGIVYIASPRHMGCFDHTGENLVIALPLAILAAVFGHASRFKAGYRIGYAGAVLALLGLVTPARKSPGPIAAQASAIGSLRTINTAEIAYASAYGGTYSPSLAAMDGPPGANGAGAAGLIDSELASGVKYLYRFIYRPAPPDASGRIKRYSLVARPIEFGEITTNSYYTDETGVIRWTRQDREATASDPPIIG